MKAKSSDWFFILIATLAGGAYFIFLRPFYLRAYEVPDYFEYYGMGHEQYPAMDGFSSLFIKIASYSLSHYQTLHYVMLAFLSFAITISNYTFISYCKNTYKRFFFLFFSFSISSWYYFDGKIFYEFPFIAFNFAILFWLIAPLFFNAPQKDSKLAINYLRLLFACLLAGLCFSWKSHALFPIFGLFGLIFIHQFKVLIKISPHIIIFATLMVLLGYIAGNFHLIDEPISTIQGIKGYPGRVEVLHYLFNDERTVWDHINFFSFNTSVFNVSSAFILLFICPLALKEYKQVLLFNALITALFLIIINNMSRGYPWHGFPFSLYLLTFACFFLANLEESSKKYLGYTFFILCLALQIYKLIFSYLPQQIVSYKSTEQSIEIIHNRSKLIVDTVTDIISKKGSMYSLNLLPKRSDQYRKSPIASSEKDLWEGLIKKQCLSNCSPKYKISIIPYPLFQITSFSYNLGQETNIIPFDDFLIGISRIKD